MIDRSGPRARLLIASAALRQYAALALTIMAFVALAGVYVRTTPLFEMPEEPWHLRRMAYYADKTLPSGSGSWVQHAPVPSVEKQPPLYYWLGAAIVLPFDWASEPSIYELNPHARLADLTGVTNRNALLARVAAQPDGPLSRTIYLLRWLSVLVAAVGQVYAYRILLRLTSGRTWLALAALLVTAFIPGYVYQSSGISPVPLGLCLTIVSTYYALRMVEEPGYPRAVIRAAAYTAGLAAMTVWWGWLAVVIVAVAWRMRAAEWKVSRGPGHHGVPLSLALMLGMAMIWPAQLVFAGPIGAPTIWSRVAGMGLLDRLVLALKAFFGTFGWLDIPLGSAYYTAIAMVTLFGVSGLILRGVQWYWRTPDRESLVGEVRGRVHPWQRIVVLWGLLGCLVLSLHILSPASLYIGDALMPLAPLIALFLVLGISTWLQTYGAAIIGVLLTALLAVAVSAPGTYIEPAYALPQPLTLPQISREVHPLDVSYGDSLYLVGYLIDDDNGHPGGSVTVRLYWLARRTMTSDYTAHVTVSGYGDTIISSIFTRAGAGVYPTSMWAPGDVIAQDIVMPIVADAIAPTAGILAITVSDEATGEVLNPTSPAGETLSQVLPVTRVRIGPVSAAHYAPTNRLDANLDGQITLMGYDIDGSGTVPGERLGLTLYWRSEGPLLADYTVFVHVVDSSGEMLTQADSQPLGGSYPTGLWTMGEQVRDRYSIQIPASATLDDLYLDIGMYVLQTDERLSISYDGITEDHVRLGPLSDMVAAAGS